MAPGCKPGGLTPYAGSNPAPCTMSEFRISECGFGIYTLRIEFRNPKFAIRNSWAGVAQLVEHQPSKLRVASSSLVARSSLYKTSGDETCPSLVIDRASPQGNSLRYEAPA